MKNIFKILLLKESDIPFSGSDVDWRIYSNTDTDRMFEMFIQDFMR